MTTCRRLCRPLIAALAGAALPGSLLGSGCGSQAQSPDYGSPVVDAASGGMEGSTSAREGGSGTVDGGGAEAGGSAGGDAVASVDAGTGLGGKEGGGAGNGNDGGELDGAQDGEAATPWGLPVPGGPTGTGIAAVVTVDPGSTVGTIGADFMGFSYEKTHITNGSLTGSNAALVALYKLLGRPSMRLGADDVDNCNWSGTGQGPTAPSGQPFTHTIVSGMVDGLCEFLAATGSQVIYGVNFKSDNVAASAAEAAYVQNKCAGSVSGFEIGNEINRYGSWASLQAEWESFGTAIVATPGALLVGPAAGGGDALSLSTPFAADESKKFGDKLVLLTQHYYAGTAGKPSASVATLQTPDPDSPTSQDGLVGTESTMDTAATTNKIPLGYRLGECNTFAGHGEAGISDALVAGLWVLDLAFVTAQHGGSGINLHGGELGMDGHTAFEYSPIMETNGVVVQAMPVYYGMLLFSLAGQGAMVATTLQTSNPYFTAYAIQANGWMSVVLDNKNATSGVNATVDIGSPVTSASAIYLQGTPADDLTAAAGDVTLAGAAVSPDGVWKRAPPYSQSTSGNTVSAYVPPASAALVRIFR